MLGDVFDLCWQKYVYVYERITITKAAAERGCAYILCGICGLVGISIYNFSRLVRHGAYTSLKQKE